MDMQFFDENALKALIRRFSTSSDPYAREDLDTVEKAMQAFHNYINTVVDGEMKLLIQGGSLEGQAYSTLPAGMETTVKIKIADAILSSVVFGAIDYETDALINFIGVSYYNV